MDLASPWALMEKAGEHCWDTCMAEIDTTLKFIQSARASVTGKQEMAVENMVLAAMAVSLPRSCVLELSREFRNRLWPPGLLSGAPSEVLSRFAANIATPRRGNPFNRVAGAGVNQVPHRSFGPVRNDIASFVLAFSPAFEIRETSGPSTPQITAAAVTCSGRDDRTVEIRLSSFSHLSLDDYRLTPAPGQVSNSEPDLCNNY
jgi:hypothetical protein